MELNFFYQKKNLQRSLSKEFIPKTCSQRFLAFEYKDNVERKRRKVFVAVVLISKRKNLWEQDYLCRCSFEAAKAATGGVLKFYARSLKKMFERVHFQVKQHARSLLK